MIPTKAQIRAFYDRSREGKLGRHTDPFEQIGRLEAILTLIRQIAAQEPTIALDVGCGAGWLTTEISRAIGPGIVGVDLSPNSLREAVAGTGSQVPWVAMDAEQLAIRDTCAELIVCSELLEHLASPGTALAEMRRVVQPAGWVILTTPNPWAVQFQYEAFKVWVYRVFFHRQIRRRRRQIIDQPLSPRRLNSMVRQSGFRLVRRRGTHYFPPMVRGRIPLRRLAERASRLIERFNLLPYLGLYQVLLLQPVSD